MPGRMLDSDAAAVAVEYSCYAGEARKVMCPPQYYPFQEMQLQGKPDIMYVIMILNLCDG
jgi:hypothetical protein